VIVHADGCAIVDALLVPRPAHMLTLNQEASAMSIQTAAKYNHLKWQAVAAKARKKPETRLFIDGKFVDAKKGGRLESVNPATGEVIAESRPARPRTSTAPSAAAFKAFKSGCWSKMAPAPAWKS
jgi:gamma-glutamyl-gamma-aminobutyraldehyde dehydrogenase